MRILLLSDVHANWEALEACLAAAPSYDSVANLGDVVGYGASPNEVIQRTRELDPVLVRGNHDKACAGISDMEHFNPMAAYAVYWTREVLTPDNLDWLRALPHGPILPSDVEGVQYVHGSPLDEEEYLIGPSAVAESMENAIVPVTFFGHTHIQGVFLLRPESTPEQRRRPISLYQVANRELELEDGMLYFVNPGSVGQPRDGDWRAACALYDSDARTVKFLRVPYDVKAAQQRILDAHLPEWLATRLSEGR